MRKQKLTWIDGNEGSVLHLTAIYASVAVTSVHKGFPQSANTDERNPLWRIDFSRLRWYHYGTLDAAKKEAVRYAQGCLRKQVQLLVTPRKRSRLLTFRRNGVVVAQVRRGNGPVPKYHQ